MNFKTYRNLFDDIVEFSKKLPPFDLIVGIPRSGLLAANMLALHRNVPLWDIYSLASNSPIKGGQRLNYPTNIKNVLVLDDSSLTGKSIQEAKDLLKNSAYNIKYAAVYHSGKPNVDYFHQIVPSPRVWEWNLFHSWVMGSSCLDIDGVLCVDPTNEENDDGQKYVNFLLNATPLYIPTVKVETLCTSRLEKYRELTKQWLLKHNIQFNNLIMAPYNTMQERRQAGKYAELKANEFRKEKYHLFVESSIVQAKEIYNRTKKSVFCIETKEFFK